MPSTRDTGRPLLRGWPSLRWVALALILVGGFVYYPIADNFIVSMTRQDIYSGEVAYVGAENYRRLLDDPVAWTALRNNVLYAAISVLFQVFAAFVLAAIVEGLENERWRRFWRAVYFIPSAISVTVAGLLFYFIYEPKTGLLDGALSMLGLGALIRPWLGSEQTALYAVIAMSQWQGFGYCSLLFGLAMQKIPREIYDASTMDGAGPLRRLWSITFPMTREMTGLMLIVTVTGAFQVFNEVMVMTAGGPNNSSQVLGTWLYQQGFMQNDFGYGAAIAAVIFAITLGSGMAQLWYTKRRRVRP
ncbi:sugar ABC transporter permease [Verminephrobacter aporrectodeae subsp. tuberculatae]|uniref:carbohydrate ABC transporter permease n=1 Tax=Verminephrobacter aporrectodeae TaxID=1110389 RepID=UPI0022389F3D|nr:sugar ABC transporter permease [Verminephrobacter aporrectodeae]MCW5219796.1 sugar ABC transporter permease [Verminephrobacter aporrectodeae subsp. tuberculatae]MCW5256207.1 sugar ABC transporter permease [Verminephrobacter aporrectodeae subsp. tuberculatae]MCW5287506.1 sugar ABC transporter permease [Verminephrobacter aporrectodeae subsp. tuberculatae]MCW8209036.1 sugar ABC transporter permease [Verminephrobacter aporrectodeae subsp. tuberculatae]